MLANRESIAPCEFERIKDERAIALRGGTHQTRDKVEEY